MHPQSALVKRSFGQLIIGFRIVGALSLLIGFFFFIVHALGGPIDFQSFDEKYAGVQLSKSLMIAAVTYLLFGLGLSFAWRPSRKWVAGAIIGLTTLHSIGVIFFAIAQPWYFLDSIRKTPFPLLLVIPIAVNCALAWLVWMATFKRDVDRNK